MKPMLPAVTIEQSLAWRLARHGLDPQPSATVAEVADRVVALRGWPHAAAEASIHLRQAAPIQGSLGEALRSGTLIRSYALRGSTCLFTPHTGAALLALHTITRSWETERYQRQAGFTLDDWQPFREAMRDILDGGPRTRAEIADQLADHPRVGHLALAAGGAGADALYKPLHWWGDISFGPEREGRATFQLLAGQPHWPGPPDIDEAGHQAIRDYLCSYAPATRDNLHYWLTDGLGVPRRQVSAWLADLAGELTEVVTGGHHAYVLSADLEPLRATGPSDAIHLLPSFDPWVMGSGTADARIIAEDRRAVATRGAHLVLWRGRVAGSWRRSGSRIVLSWFSEAGPAPQAELERHGADTILTVG